MPAAEGVFPKVDNDPLYGSEASALGIVNVVAGEGLTAGNVVYIKKSDGKAYQSGTGTASDIRADGIVINSPLITETAYVQISGNYITSGLTSGEVYYLGAAGAVSTTRSCIEVGVATATTNLFVNIVQDDADPIGTIKQVAASITGVPTYNISAFWTLCDGTIISDAESPLNGQTIRDLNGNNEFLRSADTSGGTGGESTHVLTTAEMPSHTHTYGVHSGGYSTGTACALGVTDAVNGWPATGGAGSGSAHENKPPYYNVVAIIKYK
jgi:hypothetical protein